MNLSLIVARLSLVSAAITAGATWFGSFKPQWAAVALGIAAAINAFTERVQGGASKQK